MSKRGKKPIELKTLEAKRATQVAEMLSDLEGTSRRSGSQKAIWTRDFLASGKPGKLPGARA